MHWWWLVHTSGDRFEVMDGKSKRILTQPSHPTHQTDDVHSVSGTSRLSF